jgi:L-asparaginase II
MPDSVLLARTVRGGIEDDVHRGSMVIADTDGKVLAAVGNPEKRAFIRSSGKPLQALAFVEQGGADHYGLTPAEIAIICASHAGKDMHVATVGGLLSKAGIPLSALGSGGGIRDNCSGKHSGMLAFAKLLGQPLGNYRATDHPIQREILRTVSELCDLPQSEIGVAVDGCGAPIFAMPLRNMAVGYARLANPDGLPPARAQACRTIGAAMQAHPEMVGGLDWTSIAPGKFVAKAGAAGCYCVGIVGRNAAFAMKVSDGSALPVHSVCVELLTREGYLAPEERRRFLELHPQTVTNRCGEVVGELEIVF